MTKGYDKKILEFQEQKMTVSGEEKFALVPRLDAVVDVFQKKSF